MYTTCCSISSSIILTDSESSEMFTGNVVVVLQRPSSTHNGKLDLSCKQACMVVEIFSPHSASLSAERPATEISILGLIASVGFNPIRKVG